MMNLKYIGMLGVLLLSDTVGAVTRDAQEVFAKWHMAQSVFTDKPLDQMGQFLDDGFVQAHNRILRENRAAIAPIARVVAAIQGRDGDDIVPLAGMTSALKEHLLKLYRMADQDMPAFVAWLQEHGLHNDRRNDVGNPMDSTTLIETHNNLNKLLFAHTDEHVAYEFRHLFANRVFEYVFDTSWPETRFAMYERCKHPILRFLNSEMWFYLSGNGWKNASQECYKSVAALAKTGKRVVYPGGGSDIELLLKFGVPNATIIDPQLPSQGRYYAEGGDWLIKGSGANGGIGDVLTCADVQLERIGYQEEGVFQARLADGTVATLPKSTTTWAVRDHAGNPVGTYVFQRRFVKQDDFAHQDKQVVLLSFNELYFIELPSMFGGWGILPFYFSDDQQIFVKQLRKPVSKRVLCNMRMADSINFDTFNYIALGTCVD